METIPQPSKPIAILAAILIGLGTFVAACVLAEINNTYQNPASNKFMTDFAGMILHKPLLLNPNGGDTQLGEAAANIITMGFFAVFVIIAISAAVGLIRAGVHVFSPQFDYQLGRLKQRIDAIVQRMKS